MLFFLQKARGFPAFSDGVTDSKYTITWEWWKTVV